MLWLGEQERQLRDWHHEYCDTILKRELTNREAKLVAIEAVHGWLDFVLAKMAIDTEQRGGAGHGQSACGCESA